MDRLCWMPTTPLSVPLKDRSCSLQDLQYDRDRHRIFRHYVRGRNLERKKSALVFPAGWAEVLNVNAGFCGRDEV